MSDPADGGTEHPIERGFPISEVSALAERESRAKLHYRPLTTMHKWWAQQPGSVLRAICLYALLDDPERVRIGKPLDGETSLSQFTDGEPADDPDFDTLIDGVDLESPDKLWDLYQRDVRVEDVDVLDPFMGGGTSLLEASRFGASVTGVDLNPVAWFMTKKEFEAVEVERSDLQEAFEQVKSAVSTELQQQYRTGCPNDADHVADVMYALWVRTLDCISCGETIPLFSNYRVAGGRYEDSNRYHVTCPDCKGLFLTDDPATEAVCSECGNEFIPDNGPVSQGGKYGCPACGLKYPIVDAIADGQSYAEQLYALEYYCTECDDAGEERTTFKGYKSPDESDLERFEAATERWEESDELSEYVPSGQIPDGAITAASSISGNDIFQHGYENWQDMFNGRQLYCLSTLLRAINDIEDSMIQEFLLLAFSDTLLFQNNFAWYSSSGKKIEGALGRNSYTPRRTYAENNVWGTRAGRGTFSNTWQKILDAVEFAHNPTERYLDDGDLQETEPFGQLIGGEYTLHQGDMREVPAEGTFDAIITDPPYYDNVVYSELSDFFYVWQRLLLSDSYEWFDPETTPRADSIVPNPAVKKDAATFESELQDAFGRMRELLDDDGILTFTYRTGGTESWGKLVDALCSEGFDLNALYPIAGNSSELFASDDLNVTVIVVARPSDSTEPVSWSALRRKAHREARTAREQLEQSSQSLSEGEAAIVELGRCLRVYSKHHGSVHRDGKTMDPVDVVAEFEDLVTGEVSSDEIYLSLLEMESPSERDLRRLCHGTDVSPDDLREKGLLSSNEGFELAAWDDESRQAYLSDTADADLTSLDLVHQLRADVAATSKGQLRQQREVEVTNELMELATDLATLTNDEEYRRLFHE
jgi:putative DNA methylase